MRRWFLVCSSGEEGTEGIVTTNGAPKGFGPLVRTSPLIELLGPFYSKGTGTDLILGLCVAEKHTSARGFAHGGVLLTLADVALGYAAESSVDPPARLITASVSADFAGSARLGDWVEARVDVQRVGGRMTFANAYLHVGDRRVARASAVFARAGGKEGVRPG